MCSSSPRWRWRKLLLKDVDKVIPCTRKLLGIVKLMPPSDIFTSKVMNDIDNLGMIRLGMKLKMRLPLLKRHTNSLFSLFLLITYARFHNKVWFTFLVLFQGRVHMHMQYMRFKSSMRFSKLRKLSQGRIEDILSLMQIWE